MSRNDGAFIVVIGFIVRLGKQTLVIAPRSGQFWVKWKNNRLPAGVKLGSQVTLIGKLITMDLGKFFLVVNAQAFPPNRMARIKKALNEP